MLTRKFLFVSTIIGLILPTLALANVSNLVTNGGFETGDFTGWTTNPVSYPQFIVTSPVNSGTYAAQIAGYSNAPDTLSQTITTTTAGQTYDLSFWREQSGGPTTSLAVTWNGTIVFSELNPGDQGGPYANFSALVTGTGSDVLEFISSNDPGYTYLDDVSVTATPEPGFYGILAMGLSGLVVAIRRRNRA